MQKDTLKHETALDIPTSKTRQWLPSALRTNPNSISRFTGVSRILPLLMSPASCLAAPPPQTPHGSLEVPQCPGVTVMGQDSPGMEMGQAHGESLHTPILVPHLPY